MVNEFLPKERLIVYTEGRMSPREDYYSNGRGNVQQMPIVVLMDERSASASEIFAGAIQDNDRGTVIGRRSFGKGLVQQPIDFSDGSAIRLTIARYHTPSGRCIQRPYENGKDEHYNMDWVERYEKGEFFSEDSIKQNKELQYTTGLGRIVYGGGGIMPDVFVPQDTTGVSSYLIEVSNKGLITQYSFNYSDNNRPELTKHESWNDLLTHLEKQNVVHSFIRYADSKGVKRRNLLIQQSFTLLERYLYGNIIYNILGQEEYIKFLNQSDDTVKRALQILQKGESFPKAPETNNLEVANNG
jgi:carboxyl-terminal processing protease